MNALARTTDSSGSHEAAAGIVRSGRHAAPRRRIALRRP